MNFYGKHLEVTRVLDVLGICTTRTIHNELYAHCPFHTDRHPSFVINRTTGLWICHRGCGAGNIIQLWCMVTGDDITATMRQLVKLTVSYSEKELLGMVDDGRLSAAAYQPKPMKLQNYTSFVPQYWLDRGFSVPFSEEWGIGWDAVLDAVVFPIHNQHGQIVGASRRMVDPKKQPKYLHDLGTPCKSVLFGLHRASGKVMIITEGPVDCLWLHQYGYTNTVALMGSSLSGAQKRLILQRTGAVTLFLDNDEVGQNATDVIAQQLLNIPVFVAQYPEGTKGQDPQDLSPLQIRDAITRAEPYILWGMRKHNG